MSFFTAEHISAGYGKTPVVQDVSFTVEAGCILGILGANGSGKTTLLKALCGILPHTGTCTLEGVPLETLSARQNARRIGYIPQRSGISIDISALDVVLMGFNPQLKLLQPPTKAMQTAARAALQAVGLSDCAEKNYLHLSEGQKQLCILARTMVAESRLLFLDEPESALDFQHRYQMLHKIKDWVRTTGGSAVLTLHDPVLALNSCHRLLLLQNGQVLDVLTPKTDSTEQMEQQLSRLYGTVSLQWCTDRRGNRQLMMLKEEEA